MCTQAGRRVFSDVIRYLVDGRLKLGGSALDVVGSNRVLSVVRRVVDETENRLLEAIAHVLDVAVEARIIRCDARRRRVQKVVNRDAHHRGALEPDRLLRGYVVNVRDAVVNTFLVARVDVEHMPVDVVVVVRVGRVSNLCPDDFAVEHDRVRALVLKEEKEKPNYVLLELLDRCLDRRTRLFHVCDEGGVRDGSLGSIDVEDFDGALGLAVGVRGLNGVHLLGWGLKKRRMDETS
eukprot:2700548-Prymnesium_polylepis.1